MIANLPARTGRSLDEWFLILDAAGLEKHGQAVSLLKSEHGVTHGFANLIVTLYLSRGASPSEQALVDAQYAGRKGALRPVYERLIALVAAFGDDVEVVDRERPGGLGDPGIETVRIARRDEPRESREPRAEVALEEPGLAVELRHGHGAVPPLPGVGLDRTQVRHEVQRHRDVVRGLGRIRRQREAGPGVLALERRHHGRRRVRREVLRRDLRADALRARHEEPHVGLIELACLAFSRL